MIFSGNQSRPFYKIFICKSNLHALSFFIYPYFSVKKFNVDVVVEFNDEQFSVNDFNCVFKRSPLDLATSVLIASHIIKADDATVATPAPFEYGGEKNF